VRPRSKPAHLRTPSIDDADGPASDYVERALEHDDRGAFIEADANQARMIHDDSNERRQAVALGEVRRNDRFGP